MIERAGHCPQIEQPDAVNELLVDFLGEARRHPETTCETRTLSRNVRGETMTDELAARSRLSPAVRRGWARASSRRFVAEGARVVIADVDRDAGEALAADVGADALFRHADVGDQTRWPTRVDDGRAVRRPARDGQQRRSLQHHDKGLLDDDLEDFDRVMRVNVLGVMAGTRDAARHMAEHGGGSIINIVVDRRHPGRWRCDDLPSVEGRRHPLQQVRGDRAGALRDSGELHRSRQHPHADAAERRPARTANGSNGSRRRSANRCATTAHSSARAPSTTSPRRRSTSRPTAPVRHRDRAARRRRHRRRQGDAPQVTLI